MILNVDDVRRLSNALYAIGVGVYALSIASQSVFMTIAFHPAVAEFSVPLSGVLQFLVIQLQSLTSTPVVMLCLIGAFMLRPTLTSILRSKGEPDHPQDPPTP